MQQRGKEGVRTEGHRHSLLLGRCTGLTVIEVLVAMSLFAILVSVAVPNLIGLNEQFQLSGAANQISADLQATRMKAIAKKRKFRVIFNTGAETYQLENKPDCSCPGCNYSAVGPIRSLSPGIDIVSVSANPIFSCIGTAGAGTINLANRKGQTKSIVVDSVGRVKVN